MPPSRSCSIRALDPIVDMVLTRRDGDYEALTPDGSVRFRRGRRRRAHRSPPPRAATRSPTRRPTSSRRSPSEQANKHPHRARQHLSPRLRPDRPAVRLARGPRPLRDPLGVAQLGGPGRPPRRARLARRRAGRARRWCSRARASAPAASIPRLGPPRRRRADGRRAARLRARGRTAAYLAVQDGVALDRHPRRPTNARATSSGSCSTAPTRTCSTTWPRAAKRRTSRA